MFAISIAGYYLIRCPKLGPKDKVPFIINYFWLFITILHALWISAALILYLLTDLVFIQSIYFLGLCFYILLAAITILTISVKLHQKIKESIDKLNTMNHANFKDYVYNEDEDGYPTPNNMEIAKAIRVSAISPMSPSPAIHETNSNLNYHGNMVEPASMDQQQQRVSLAPSNHHSNIASSSKHSVADSQLVIDPIHKINDLSAAQRKVNIAITLSILIVFYSFCAFFWKSTNLRLNDDYNYNELDIFIVHYIIIFIFYISILIHHWVSFNNKSNQSFCLSIKYRIIKPPLTDTITSNSKKTKGTETDSKKALKSKESKPSSNNSKDVTPEIPTEPLPTQPFHHEKRASFAKRGTRVRSPSLPSKQMDFTPTLSAKDGKDRDIEIAALDLDNKPTMTLYGDSVVSYTELPQGRLSGTRLNLDLKAINSDGELVGRRGVKKPSKHKKKTPSQAEKIRKFAPTIEEYGHYQEKRNKMDGKKMNLNDINSITEFRDEDTITDEPISYNGSGTGTGTITGGTNTKFDRVVADVLDTMSMADIDEEPITTIVFELGDVLCTQTKKLKGKKIADLQNDVNHVQKQLYFGGLERIQMLTNWMTELKQNDIDVRFFINTEEETRLIVQLLKDVELLGFFVSRNMDNPKKLISHVIGYDHKIARNTDAKKHLILLELLKFLKRSHETMLYIGNDEEVIEHLNHIQICKTYLVEQKGLTQKDLDDIEETYFLI